VIRARIHPGLGALALALAVLASLIVPSAAVAGQYTLTFDANANQPPGCAVWTINGSTTFAYDPPCSGVPLGFDGGSTSPEPAGARIGTQTNAPSGVAITSAFVSPYEIYDLNDNLGWGGGSYYAVGGSAWQGNDAQESDTGFSSSYWGFQMICGWSSCSNFGGIFLNSIQLTATEDQGPGLTAVGSDNLWYQGGHWIRNPSGDPWSAEVSGIDPSGVCQMWAVINGIQVDSPAQTPDTAVWQQCPDWTWPATVDTTDYVPASGSMSLTLAGINAAGVVSAPSETLQVDNQPVELSMSGPSTASTTSGTQYITASATAGPSGVAIGCSVDGGVERWRNGNIDQMPVSGAGAHVVSCQGHNGAVDPQGQYAYSPTRTWSIDIGQPTVSAIGFQKIADPLVCARARKQITVPARRARVRRHHKLVSVHRPPHTKTIMVERCHARMVWQREEVLVKVRRHDRAVWVKRTKRVRVPLIPHTVVKASARVGYGRGTTVSGWMGTAGGAPMSGVPVDILTAPNNGVGGFTTAATTITAGDGAWSAQLGPGPSRLVEAAYAGSTGLLPAVSAPVELNVPARISISAAPRKLPWRNVVTLRGHLDGGYIPPDGVALRLLIKLPNRSQLYEPLALRTDAAGNFLVHWTWGSGSGILTDRFAIATTATESDYPFAASQSRWVSVTFGVTTPPRRHHHHHHHQVSKRYKRSRATRRHHRPKAA
jgi:hypothetical protein